MQKQEQRGFTVFNPHSLNRRSKSVFPVLKENKCVELCCMFCCLSNGHWPLALNKTFIG